MAMYIGKLKPGITMAMPVGRIMLWFDIVELTIEPLRLSQKEVTPITAMLMAMSNGTVTPRTIMLIAMSNGTVTLRTTMAMSKGKVALWSRSKVIVDLTIEPLRRKKTP